jgi:hypothetical protein
MTDTASATVGGSSGARGTVSEPGGLPCSIAGWSAMGRAWNSATGMDASIADELPKRLGTSCAVSSASKSSVLSDCVSDSGSCLNVVTFFFLNIHPVYSAVRGGSKP